MLIPISRDCRERTQSGYAASVSNFKNMSLATDMVFADGAVLETPVLTGSAVEGFVATLDVTV